MTNSNGTLSFLRKPIRLREWQLDIIALVYIVVGVVIGMYMVTSGFVPNLFAETATSVAIDSDTALNQGTLTDVEVVGTGDGAYLQLPGGAGDWADAAWQYRRPLTINSTNTNIQTEYQVKVTLNTGNFDYTNVQNDCDDIRFGNTSGSFLNHYQISCNTSGTSEFWVQVDSIAASGNTTIYVYYGNNGAATASDIVSTFSYSTEKTVGYTVHTATNLLNVRSLMDSNSISHNGTTLNLDDGANGTFNSVSNSGAITAKGLFDAEDNSNDTDAFVPVGFAGTEFLGTSRSSGSGTEEFYLLSPWGSASVIIYADGAQCYANTVGSTVVETGTNCSGSDGTTYRITSDIPILAYMDQGTTDPYPLHYSDVGPWYGIPGSRYAVSANASGANITIFNSGAATSGGQAIGADSDYSVSAGGSFGSGPAYKVTGDNPITANQWGDGDGGDAAFFLPYYELGTKFGGYFTLEYIAVAAPTAATCTVYNDAGGQVAQFSATSSNSEVYKIDFGTGNSTTYVGTAWDMTCDAPVYAYAQKASDSEVSLWSYPQMRQFTYPTPAINNVGAEEGSLTPDGTWASAGDVNALDLVWNGGWGDGTDGSTAFSTTVAGVSANATITFEMRAADSVANLSGATYYEVGVANTGTSFTATKAELDALAIPTGSAGRYVQVRASLHSANGIDNPQLDTVTVYYLADDTAPTTNASAIQMFESGVGAEYSGGDWVNVDTPYFTWVAGADTQAGILGYCAYLGTDVGGDPALAKGLLGTSPVDTTGTTCQFIIDATTLDLSDTNLHGDPWLTSSNSTYYLNLKAIDAAGNIFTGSLAQFNFKFDNTPPDNPSYFSLPGDFISSKDATWTWPTVGGDAASDDHSGVAGVQYRITASGTWYGDSHTGAADDFLVNDGVYTTDATYDYPLLEEGSNFIYMRTVDNAGNVTNAFISGVLKINTVAPTPPQSLQVTPTDNTLNSYGFTWDPPGSFTGLESNLEYCYTVNTLPSLATCTYTAPGANSLDPDAYATQPGTNTLYLVARDEASNINYDTYTQVEFTYSGTAPGFPVNLDVADISIKATANWRLSLAWEEPTNVGAGVASYKIYRSTTNTTCTDNFAAFSLVSTIGGSTFFADTGLSQQNYYYCVKACDSANNCSASSATSTGFPDGKFTEPAALQTGPTVTGITTRRATIAWVTERESDTKLAYGLSSGNYFAEEPSKPDQVVNHELTLNSLTPGTTYFYKAKWTDEDGNTGLSAEKSFTTLPAPTVRDVEVLSINLDSALIRFTAKGANQVQVLYGKTTGFGGIVEVDTSPVESTYTVLLSGLDDGTKYFYKIDPVDAEGFSYEGTVLSLETLPRPQVSTIQIQEVKGAAQPTIEVIWDSNTAITSVVSYYPESNPAAARDEVDINLIEGEHKVQVTGLLPQTSYILVVKGVDKLGNEAVSATQRFTTATDSRPPEIANLNIEGTILTSGGATGGDQTAQLIVSWDTDEPATSQVEFGEGTAGSYTRRTQEDTNLTYNHLVVISNLTPSQVYHLRVISLDDASNAGNSPDTVTITPKSTDSAFELVVNNLFQIFGFLGQ